MKNKILIYLLLLVSGFTFGQTQTFNVPVKLKVVSNLTPIETTTPVLVKGADGLIQQIEAGQLPITSSVTAGLNLKLDKGGYTGNAQNLKTAIDNIYQPNALISSVTPTRSVNTFTYPAGSYTAIINKSMVTNTAQFVTTITPATTNYKRVDLIYIKSDNTLAKIVGTESLTVAIRPDVPADAVGISFINVYGSVIDSPTPITNEISIQDSLGAERFKVAENGYMRFKGASFSSSAKQIEIDPLVGGVIFVSSSGNDATAEPENRNKPYLTLDAAITAYYNFPQINRVEILTASVFTINRNLKPPTGVRQFTLYSEVASTVNITFNGEYAENTQIVNLNMPNGTLNFVPTTDAWFGFCYLTINVSNFTKGISFRGRDVRSYDIKATNCTINGIEFIARGGAFNSMILKNIKFVGVSSLFTSGLATSGEILLDFDNITHDNSFTITPWCTKFNLNHGNISPSNSFNTWFSCLGGNASTPTNINYKTGATITSNLGFRRDAPDTLTLTGICNYTNSDYLFADQTVNNNTSIINAVITCKTLLAGSTYGTILISNSTIKIIEFFVNATNNLGGFTYTKPAVKFEGSCFVISNVLPENFNLFARSGIPTSNKPWVDTVNSVLYTNGKFDRSIIDIVEKPMNQYYDTTQRQLVLVDEKQEIVNKDLDPTKTYVINGKITLLAGEYIRNSTAGTTMQGYGYDTSGIEKNVAGEAIIISPSGNSGNLTLSSMYFNAGAGSVFDLKDSNGTHAIELNDVNFNSSASLGTLNGYRQLTATTCGIYSCLDGFTFEGTWTGAKITNTNVIGFGGSGKLFKKGTTTLFNGRFYANLNMQIATGAVISDFGESNITNDQSLQFVDNYVKVNGVINPSATSLTFPNISVFSTKARFVNNIGINNSRYVVPDAVNANEAVNLGQLSATSVSTAFTSKTYISTMSVAHNVLSPNFYTTLTGNLSLSITGTSNGNSGLVNLYFSGTRTATLNGTKSLVITATNDMIPVYFIHDSDGLKWYKDGADLEALNSVYASQDATKLYHTVSYLSDGTFSNTGATIVGTGTAFNSTHIGSKLVKANGETAVIATVTDFTHATTISPFKTNSTNTAYTTMHVASEIKSDGSIVTYSPVGDVTSTITTGGEVIFNQQRFLQNGNAVFTNSVKVDNINFYQDDIGLPVWGMLTSRSGTSGDPDVGLRRNKAGVYEVNTGTAESFGRLKVKTVSYTATAYANDAAADADTELDSGELYWVTGDRTPKRKP